MHSEDIKHHCSVQLSNQHFFAAVQVELARRAMYTFGPTTLVLLVLTALSLGKVEYSSIEDNVEGKFSFHKESKYKRQTSTPTNRTVQDEHVYYTSVYHPPGAMANSLWVELSDIPDTEEVNLTSFFLSNNYRSLALHPLPFEFPFFGHLISNIAVTTGGFLYASDYLHPELIPLTHNIAPLQADFNPTFNDTAQIFIDSTDDRFTVQWDQVHNHNHVDAGPFTFQVSLFSDGTIHFVYKEIPLPISSIDNDDHPVDVGLSDSLYIDEVFPGDVVVRSVYEYSRISLNASQNLSYSAYVITPVPNCVVATSCDECIRLTDETIFQCEWCPSLGRCSDGIDRNTQQWLDSGCLDTAVPSCGQPAVGVSVGAVAGISVGAVVVLAIIVLLIVAVVIVLIAYKRPTSRLGLFIIEHRPKARTLNKTSASYNIESGRTELKQDLGS